MRGSKSAKLEARTRLGLRHGDRIITLGMIAPWVGKTGTAMIKHPGKSISLALVFPVLGGLRGEQMEQTVLCCRNSAARPSMSVAPWRTERTEERKKDYVHAAAAIAPSAVSAHDERP